MYIYIYICEHLVITRDHIEVKELLEKENWHMYTPIGY